MSRHLLVGKHSRLDSFLRKDTTALAAHSMGGSTCNLAGHLVVANQPYFAVKLDGQLHAIYVYPQLRCSAQNSPEEEFQ